MELAKRLCLPAPPRLEGAHQEDIMLAGGRLAAQGVAESAVKPEGRCEESAFCFLRSSGKGGWSDMEQGVQQTPEQASLPPEGGDCFQTELAAGGVAQWRSVCWHGQGLSFHPQHYQGSLVSGGRRRMKT